MSALPSPRPLLQAMAIADLEAVCAIETQVYAVPWTRGNFIDSMASGYHCRVLVQPRGPLLGYFVAMPGVDELHLLNITVAPAAQGQGLARRMLDEVTVLCRQARARELWLEVRLSNERAKALYLRYGFVHVGTRRAYYPMPPGVIGREDALVMSLKLSESDDGLE